MGGDEADGGGEYLVEALDGTHGHERGLGGDGFGALIENEDVGELDGAADLLEERGFLAVGLDQGEGEHGRPVFEGEAGEAGAAAEIEDILGCIAWEKMAGGKERLAEVADDHLFRGAQGGEVHALVPADKQVEVSLNGGKHLVVEIGGGNEGREQLSQEGVIHSDRINDELRGWDWLKRLEVEMDGAEPIARGAIRPRQWRFEQAMDDQIRRA